MLRFYQLASIVAIPILLPLVLLALVRAKYRRRLPQRLGFGLAQRLANLPPRQPGTPTIWVHALSVGETTSALPLVAGIRRTWPTGCLVFSVTTTAGHQVAERLIAPHVDILIPSPLDLAPVISRFIEWIRPDCFLLVETDFWPNWLAGLSARAVPTMLVNGRVSAQSLRRYLRFRWFFEPMFRSFSLLALQTSADADKMRQLGVDPKRVRTLGNLKFDISSPHSNLGHGKSSGPTRKAYGFSETAPLWICGSTHRGEEEQILRIHRRLRQIIPGLQLLLAPRNIERTEEILALAHPLGLAFRLRTENHDSTGSMLLLDTIGELASCYPMAEVVFIGGSLVPLGGHNPLEPAAAAIPVLFGPHMDDFAEIAALLVDGKGARQVDGAESLYQTLVEILTNPALRKAMAAAAAACVRSNQGVVPAHLQAIEGLLAPGNAIG